MPTPGAAPAAAEGVGAAGGGAAGGVGELGGTETLSVRSVVQQGVPAAMDWQGGATAAEGAEGEEVATLVPNKLIKLCT